MNDFNKFQFYCWYGFMHLFKGLLGKNFALSNIDQRQRQKHRTTNKLNNKQTHKIALKFKTIENLKNTVTKLKLTLVDKVLDGNLQPTSTPPPLFYTPSYASVYKNLLPSTLPPPPTIFPVLLQTNKQGRLNRNDFSDIVPFVPSKDGSVVIHFPSSNDKSNADKQQINSYSEVHLSEISLSVFLALL